MPIVGGLDIHRKQLTFDYLDTATGEVKRGQIAPADRAPACLAGAVRLLVRGCVRAGGVHRLAVRRGGAGRGRRRAHVAEPADTAFARGRKRHAKTDKTDSRHLRELLAPGPRAQCWIPPSHILECRALLETYHDLRAEHTAWVQRIHAVFFHQGAPALGDGALRTGRDLEAVRTAAACHLSPAGQLQVATAWGMPAGLEDRLDVLRHRLLDAARHLTGAKVLAERLYGVGATGLAMTCWLGGAGRFSSSRKAVRFAGLDVTGAVFRTARARPGGCPGRARRCCAGRCMRPARPTPAPQRPTTAITRRSRTARTVSAPRCPRPARSSGRPATSWPSSATTRSPAPEPGIPVPWWPSWRGRAGRRAGAELTRWGITAASFSPARCQPLPVLPRRARRTA